MWYELRSTPRNVLLVPCYQRFYGETLFDAAIDLDEWEQSVETILQREHKEFFNGRTNWWWLSDPVHANLFVAHAGIFSLINHAHAHSVKILCVGRCRRCGVMRCSK